MPLNTAIRGAQIEETTISGGHLIDNTIPEVKLNIANDPGNNKFLEYTTASGMQWSTITLADMVVSEVPTGTVGGGNKDFDLANTPIADTEMIYLNGLLQERGGVDYTISGKDITFVVAPEAGDILLATYLKNQGLSGGGGISAVVDDMAPQLGGNLDLNDKSLNYGAPLSSNTTYEGEIMTVTVDDGSAAFGVPLYCAADGNYDRANATASGTMPCRALALESGSGSKKIFHKGQICATAWDWTPGKDIYVGTTVGTLTQTAPAASGNEVQIVGYALSADTIFFNPEYGMVEIA
jgi:hypothetical protein